MTYTTDTGERDVCGHKEASSCNVAKLGNEYDLVLGLPWIERNIIKESTLELGRSRSIWTTVNHIVTYSSRAATSSLSDAGHAGLAAAQ